jgi:hypothetical protein
MLYKDPSYIKELDAKGRHTAVCELFNHPTRRVEMRCTIDGEL